VASLGILGGSFNPPHLGHLAVARHALEELALERVTLMPANSAPHKRLAEDPGAGHRLEMCRIAVAADERLSACALEIERGGPSYTVDTLISIHASHPDARLTFIVGADTARTLPGWRAPARILELAELAVAARAGSARDAVLESVAGLSEHRGAARREPRFLAMGAVEVSSSAVRRAVAAGEPIVSLVGEGVARYIAEHGLYREKPRSRGPAI
jgi:nicotinate-nucleotide adenylyltransferase